jgi:hypothetical protein
LDGRQAAGGASREKNDWIVQEIPQHVVKAIRVLSTRKIVNGDPAAEAGMALFPTALGLYGGVLLWSGELQGFIIHEMVPIEGGSH